MSEFFSILFFVHTAFAQNDIDTDLDKIPNNSDLCPTIPGNGSDSGCPIFERWQVAPNTNHNIKVQWLDKREGLILHEKKEVQLGDIIWAVIKNPKTGEIYSKSQGFGVME